MNNWELELRRSNALQQGLDTPQAQIHRRKNKPNDSTGESQTVYRRTLHVSRDLMSTVGTRWTG